MTSSFSDSFRWIGDIIVYLIRCSFTRNCEARSAEARGGGDWKRDGGIGGKGSPEGFLSGGDLGVSPSFKKVPQDWGI